MASLGSQRTATLFASGLASKSNDCDAAIKKKSGCSQSKINKRLDFDSYDDDEPRSSSPDAGSIIRHEAMLKKKLIFNFDHVSPLTSPNHKLEVDLDEDEDDDDDDDDDDEMDMVDGVEVAKVTLNSSLSPIELRKQSVKGSMTTPLSTALKSFHRIASTPTDTFSPCRTRSGRIYTTLTNSSVSSCSDKSKCSGGKTNPSSSGKLPVPIFIDRPTHDSSGSLTNNRVSTAHLLVQDVREFLRQKENSSILDKTHPDEENMELDLPSPTLSAPPPLNHVKRPMSRLHTHCTPAALHSPPVNEVQAMNLVDHSPGSPISLPKPFVSKSRLIFEESRIPLRLSAPPFHQLSHSHHHLVSQRHSLVPEHGDSSYCSKERKRKRIANINPFTPSSMMASMKKRFKSQPEMNHGCSYLGDDSLHRSLDQSADQLDINPAKRLRVTDIDISRYEQEFIEIKEIASGSFGTVKVARHCLDGMLYAIKVSRNQIHVNTHQERVAMNEVFAHSALIKHKHVVRYYNSWVENGRVYIQNEYCEGGSLANLVKEYRKLGRRFSEHELKRILLHIAKGLQYIHSKQLVHLDIKPENIFLSLDHATPNPMSTSASSLHSNILKVDEDKFPGPGSTMLGKEEPKPTPDQTTTPATPGRGGGYYNSGNESTDSGHASGCDAARRAADEFAASMGEDHLSYKIGDLGHVVSIYGAQHPEEGDCRYMAPELLFHVDREQLAKADIFSLGLTLFEVASLQELPKNSQDDQMYTQIKNGDLPFVEGYSKEFNQLVKSMVSKDPDARPTAAKLVNHSFMRTSSMSKSRSSLMKELKEAKAKIQQLELCVLASQMDASSNGYLAHGPSSSTNVVALNKTEQKKILTGKAVSCLL